MKRAPLPELARGDTWIVVAKPPNLIVHRNPGMPNADAVLQRVRDQVRRRVHLVHRLDRPASGALMLATDPDAAGSLSAAFNGPGSRKTYVAFVRGTFAWLDRDVVVDMPMADSHGTVKEARSVVRCVGRSVEPRCSLLVVEPLTGRFHQVRRHVRDLGCPILGDSRHGDTRVNRWWREGYGLRRLALHALSLSVPLPEGRLDVACPLFEDLAAVLRRMPWWDEAVARVPALALPPLPIPDDVHEGPEETE